MKTLKRLQAIIEIEYQEIVVSSDIIQNKLRIYLVDNSFIDIGFSLKIPGRFSYHWERRHLDGTLYRHDNFPDPQWKEIITFPKHFHNGSQNKVEESYISEDPETGIRQFMAFIRKRFS
ncbi:MAG: hypothetical protein HPY89_11735 [Pelotomaculum sp.]|nr:hypothetical protein [Pelotomaculum sp.]